MWTYYDVTDIIGNLLKCKKCINNYKLNIDSEV